MLKPANGSLMDISMLEKQGSLCIIKVLVKANRCEQGCCRRVSGFRNSVSQNHLAGGKNEEA